MERIDISDQYDDAYTAFIAAFRRKTAEVASKVLLEQVTGQEGVVRIPTDPASSPSVAAHQFRTKLIEYFRDREELVADGSGALVPSDAVRRRARGPGDDGAADQAALGPMYEFLERYVALAGAVLAGGDALAEMDRLYGMKSSLHFWEYSMIDLPAKRPCNVLAARALVATLAERSEVTVFEGGAGIGVVLREALRDPGFARLAGRLARYEYTDISALLLEKGKEWLGAHAPPDVRRRVSFRRVDLDKLVETAPGLGKPASTDLIVLEHVLYDVRDLDATLRTFHSMLKPGGSLVFTMSFRDRPAVFFPNEFFQSMLHSYNKAKLDPPRRRHVGYLTLQEWELSLAAAGFSAWDVHPSPADHHKWPFGGIVAHR